MNRNRVFIIIGLAALVAGRLISPLAVQAQDEDSESIHDPLRTMTRILESTLNDAINPWNLHVLGDMPFLGSVFGSKIRAEYIPTVGAIFTIPIHFPLRPSEDEKGNGAEEIVEEDLWEHFSSANEHSSKATAPVLPTVELIEPLKIHINIEKDRVDEQVDGYRARAEQLKAKTYGVADQDLFLSIRDGFAWDFSFGGRKPYDPVKVSALTHTIIETIAQYGHRLESMPNSERVLVVLEAPRPLASSTVVRFGKPTPETRAREIVKEVENVVGRELDKLRVRSDRSRSIRVRGTLFKSSISRRGEHDRRLLAFKKSDLQQERSYDSIKSKVETTDY